jgi:hypothetical protein
MINSWKVRLRAKSEMEAVVKQLEALKEMSTEMELKANLKVSDYI